jgi:hypothetical protein
MKPVYIAATVQDSGKTFTSLGLMQVLRGQGIDPGYIKPVGQHWVPYLQAQVDEDAVVVHKFFNLTIDPAYLSPIAVERGFTARFIENPDVRPLEKRILDCVQTLQRSHPLLIVEGTGHAGVGSCFGLSNARVAELLGARVIIVTAGGIGKPIDEVALSLSLFRDHHVEVLGVILNKVLTDKFEKIRATVSKGLELIGTRLLGAVPYETTLTQFSIGQLAEEFNYRVLCGVQGLSNRIENVVVAAMEPQNVVPYIRHKTLVIAPGDRLDNILVAINVLAQDYGGSGGLLVTGGIDMHPTIVPLVEKSKVPVLVSRDDTFTVSSRMADIGFKIRDFDHDKILTCRDLVEKHVDTKQILDGLRD